MRRFTGHAVAETIFLTVCGGLLETSCKSTAPTRHSELNISGGGERKRFNRFQLVWYQCPGPTLSKIPLESIVKVILSAPGILIEVSVNNSANYLTYREGEFIIAKNLRDCEHALMYGFFGLVEMPFNNSEKFSMTNRANS